MKKMAKEEIETEEEVLEEEEIVSESEEVTEESVDIEEDANANFLVAKNSPKNSKKRHVSSLSALTSKNQRNPGNPGGPVRQASEEERQSLKDNSPKRVDAYLEYVR